MQEEGQKTKAARRRALVADEDPSRYPMLTEKVTACGYDVTSAYTSDEFRAMISLNDFDFVMLDMFYGEGPQLMRESLEHGFKAVWTGGYVDAPLNNWPTNKVRLLAKDFTVEQLWNLLADLLYEE